MKRGTTGLPKFRRLAKRLNLESWATAGLLESLWHFTALAAKPGDIGRYSDEDIADGIGWLSRPASELVEALVAEQWVDVHPVHRLIVHDWHEHADDSVHLSLARAATLFADGARPRTARLQKDEREKIERELSKAETCARRAHRKRTAHARHAHEMHTSLSLPPLRPPSASSPPSEEEDRTEEEKEFRAAFAERGPGEEGQESENGKTVALTTPTWEAYSSAYLERYGERPIRNAKVSSQLKQFVRLVPAEEAPPIAAFYVHHPGAFYVQRGHPVGCLVTDAQKLRTEWATGRITTATEARRNERTAGNPFAKMLEGRH